MRKQRGGWTTSDTHIRRNHSVSFSLPLSLSRSSVLPPFSRHLFSADARLPLPLLPLLLLSPLLPLLSPRFLPHIRLWIHLHWLSGKCVMKFQLRSRAAVQTLML